MKKKVKFLAIILTVLITVLCLPVNALASDVSEVEETSYEESTSIEASAISETEVTSLSELSSQVSFETTESSVETTVETETMKFLFTEEETLPTNSRMIGGGGEVDFGPPEEEGTGIIPDGVYAIENFAYPGIWMDVSSVTSAGHTVWQENFAQNPKDSFNRSALFKIAYVPATNSYTIRLMTNNLLSLMVDNHYVYTAAISPFDEIGTGKLSASSTFTITYSLGGYIISPYGDSAYAICSRGNAAGEAYSGEAFLVRDLISDAGNNARWRFHQYTGVNKSEITVTYVPTWKSIGIPVGTKGTLGCTSWSTIIGANTPYIRVAAASSAMISTTFNFTTGKMSFEALSPGSATIYHMILEGTSEPSKYTTYYNYSILPQEGTYFIRNVGTEKYIDIEGHSTEENAIIQQFKYGDADWLRWCIEHVSGGQGYVRIRSKHSQKYISVDSTDSTVIKQTSTLNNYSLWKFERTSAGNLKLINKALGTTLALSTPSSSSGNGANLKMVTYTNDTVYIDEWQLFEDVSFGDLAIDIDDTATANIITDCQKNLNKVTDYTYTVTAGADYVSVNSSTGVITALKSGTATVKATHKVMNVNYTFSVKVNKNAIIIVPGILGSELFVGSGNPYFGQGMPLFSKEIVNGLSTYQDGDTVQDLIPSNCWEFLNNLPSIVRLFNAWSDSMSCNDNGSSKYNVYVKEYRSSDPATRSNNHCGTGDAYLTLYDKLVSEYSDKYLVDLFSYDWRLSNAVSASKLDDYIEYYNYDKVILIAHSMGGLVASGYLGLGESQRDKVEQVFYLASPLLGTPAVANIWYNEDISFVESAISNAFGISVKDFNRIYKTITGIADPIQNLICNYVSVYELFPSEYYFQLTGSSYMSDSFTTIMIGGETSIMECSTYTATKDILTGYFDDFDPNLMAIAETFHDTTFIFGNHVSSYTDARYYHCLNTSVSTISHLKFYQVVSSTSYVTGLEVDGTTIYGDFLVLTTSSTLANMYPTKCLSFQGNHMTLVMTTSIIDQWIQNIS